MTAFLGISVWVTLATVVPGLITIAVCCVAVWVTAPGWGAEVLTGGATGWAVPALAVTVMVLTQTLGIQLESLLVGRGWLGPRRETVAIPEGIDPLGDRAFELRPYEEYAGLYLLLAELRPDEDTQGHLQRCTSQFFLTNNSLVSFAVGIVATAGMWVGGAVENPAAAAWYLGMLVACLVISYRVERIRFRVMAKALWATRRRRTTPPPDPAFDARLSGVTAMEGR